MKTVNEVSKELVTRANEVRRCLRVNKYLAFQKHMRNAMEGIPYTFGVSKLIGRSKKREGNNMILIACVDDDNGMMFNHRRQSQDRVLRTRILEMTARSRLWMNHYTAKQFASESAPQINIDDSFLSEAAPGDYCFSEDANVSEYEKWAEKIILYKWNRRYPGDFHFNIPLRDHGWRLTKSTDFVGSSHERITEEIYEK